MFLPVEVAGCSRLASPEIYNCSNLMFEFCKFNIESKTDDENDVNPFNKKCEETMNRFWYNEKNSAVNGK